MHSFWSSNLDEILESLLGYFLVEWLRQGLLAVLYCTPVEILPVGFLLLLVDTLLSICCQDIVDS